MCLVHHSLYLTLTRGALLTYLPLPVYNTVLMWRVHHSLYLTLIPEALLIYLSRDMRFPTMCMCDQQKLRPACAYAQSDQSLCLSLEYSMTVTLLADQHLECLSLTGFFTGSSESTLVKMPHCWKSHVTAHLPLPVYNTVLMWLVHHSLYLTLTPEALFVFCKLSCSLLDVELC